MPTGDEMTTDERRKYVNQQVAPQTFSADKWLSESIICYLW